MRPQGRSKSRRQGRQTSVSQRQEQRQSSPRERQEWARRMRLRAPLRRCSLPPSLPSPHRESEALPLRRQMQRSAADRHHDRHVYLLDRHASGEMLMRVAQSAAAVTSVAVAAAAVLSLPHFVSSPRSRRRPNAPPPPPPCRHHDHYRWRHHRRGEMQRRDGSAMTLREATTKGQWRRQTSHRDRRDSQRWRLDRHDHRDRRREEK